MRHSRHLVALRTFGLAFAVVLTPAFMQMEPDCGGDSSLAVLEFRPFNVSRTLENVIDFDSQQRVYEVELGEQSHQAMVVAEATDPSAELAIQCYVGDDFIAGHPMDPSRTWTVIDLPSGDSTVMVWVRPPEGAEGKYTFHITRSLTP